MSNITMRRANADDLAAIVALLADDPLGAQREDASTPLNSAYTEAFRAIDADPNQLLAVITEDDRVVGTLQLSFIPGLSRRGAWRGQIEAVRVAADRRDAGLGRQAFEWAIAQCRARLPSGPADHRPGPAGRAPVLRTARLHRDPSGLQDEPLTVRPAPSADRPDRFSPS